MIEMKKYYINFVFWVEYYPGESVSEVFLIETNNLLEKLKASFGGTLSNLDLEHLIEDALEKGHIEHVKNIQYAELTIKECTDDEFDVLKKFIKVEREIGDA
jgi:hypothetical protein